MRVRDPRLGSRALSPSWAFWCRGCKFPSVPEISIVSLRYKADSVEEKADLVKSPKEAPRSKAIYVATMLALHAGMRDKEIRTIQWGRLNLVSRIVTVGESKTDAGTGHTIP